METETAATMGSMISGFQAEVVLWCWVVLVLLYGLSRSVTHPDPDAIRPSGPVD